MAGINKKFKEDRIELGMSQQDVAVLLGVSRVTYIKWEQNPDTMPIGRYEYLMHEFEQLRELKEIDIEE